MSNGKKNRNAAGVPYEALFFSRTYDFLNVFIVRQAGRSPATQKAYREGLSSFYDYVSEKLKIEPDAFQYTQCDYHTLLGYSQYLHEALGKKEATVNLRLAAVKSYLEYSADCDPSLLSVSLSAGRVPYLSIPKKQLPVVGREGLPGFLDSPKHTRTGDRDRFILIFLYDSAIRVGELVAITLGDVSNERGGFSVLIHGKGRRERRIFLSEKCSGHMKKYLDRFHHGPWDVSRPLFYSSIKGNISPMTSRNIERIVSKYGDECRGSLQGIPDTLTPHSLRRTRATTLYQDGVPIEQVSAMLGHSMIETTRTYYASPSFEQMKAVVEKGSLKEPEQQPEWTGRMDEIKRKFGLK